MKETFPNRLAVRIIRKSQALQLKYSTVEWQNRVSTPLQLAGCKKLIKTQIMPPMTQVDKGPRTHKAGAALKRARAQLSTPALQQSNSSMFTENHLALRQPDACLAQEVAGAIIRHGPCPITDTLRVLRSGAIMFSIAFSYKVASCCAIPPASSPDGC